MTRNNSPAAAFSHKGKGNYEDAEISDDADEEIEMGGAAVPEDSPRHPDNKSEAVEKAKQRHKESRPDPQDAENVPDHECDDPDAPWM